MKGDGAQKQEVIYNKTPYHELHSKMMKNQHPVATRNLK